MNMDNNMLMLLLPMLMGKGKKDGGSSPDMLRMLSMLMSTAGKPPAEDGQTPSGEGNNQMLEMMMKLLSGQMK